MLLAHRHRHDALTHINEARFLAVLEALAPSSEEARLEGMLMRAVSDSG